MKFNKLYATINTDASFKNGLAGGAFWITYSKRDSEVPVRIYSSWGFAEKNSLRAEATVILKALELVKVNNITVDVLVINTDCLGAIHRLQANDATDYFSCRYRELAEALPKSCFVQFRHVKAHTTHNNPNKRTWVNRWCDAKAKEARLHFETSVSPRAI